MDSSTPEINLPDNEEMLRRIMDDAMSPMNLVMIAAFLLVAFLLIKRFLPGDLEYEMPSLPRLRKDMTVAELKQYDGTSEDGRVLVAVNGWIFDVTRGKRFYGPCGRYAAFGGKDASRGLATFSVTTSDEYDDLSDLNSVQMESVKEWEAQFRERYELVGRLLKPGEEPMNYSDEETEETDTSYGATSDDDRKDK